MGPYEKIWSLLTETPIINPEGKRVKGVLDVDAMQSSRHHSMSNKSLKQMKKVLKRLETGKKNTTTSRARQLAFMAAVRTEKGIPAGRPNFMSHGKGRKYLTWKPEKDNS